jgi:DNA-binding CsgD family transcriptional regulator
MKNLKLVVEIIDTCLQARVEKDIQNIWLLMQDLCNIDGLILFVAESVPEVDLETTTVMRTYGINDNWADVYIAENYSLVDPVVKMLQETDRTLFSWDEAYRKHGKGAEKFIAAASSFGMFEGYTIGTKSNYFTGIACTASVTFKSKNLTEHDHTAVKSILPHLNNILSRPSFLKAPIFSEKQTEVLKWASKNKSSWEISVILGISERTVKFHLKNISRKLSVSSKVEAVQKGKMLGLI